MTGSVDNLDTLQPNAQVHRMLLADFLGKLHSVLAHVDRARPDEVLPIHSREFTTVRRNEAGEVIGSETSTINLGGESVYNDVFGYKVTVTPGDFTNDWKVQFSDAMLSKLSPADKFLFWGVFAKTDFVATGERDVAIIVPKQLAGVLESFLNQIGMRNEPERDPYDDATFGMAEGNFGKLPLVQFNASYSILDTLNNLVKGGRALAG